MLRMRFRGVRDRALSTAQYFPWDGGAVFVGTAGTIPAHAHQAIQLCFLFDGRIRLRSNNRDPWIDYELAIVPSRHTHAMDASKVHYGATLFVEPETRAGRILAERYLAEGIANVQRAPVDAAVRELRAAALEQRSSRAIVDGARAVVQSLTQHTEPSAATDERILRAVKYVNEHLSAPITLADVARVAFLSPSRFRHLFGEQTGMALKQYVLWRRFVSVWQHRMSGASLSDAAHAAGFADSAHLTRTSRRMFGFPPSAMEVSAPAALGDGRNE
jgi:AraC-like DNA-binding protein